MMNRRQFLRNMCLAGAGCKIGSISIIHNPQGSPIGISGNAERFPENVPAQLQMERRIFCQIDDPALEDALVRTASDVKADVIFDYPGTPGIIFSTPPRFLNVIDRALTDDEIWGFMISMYEEGDLAIPTIVLSDKDIPEIRHVRGMVRFSRNDYDSIMSYVKGLVLQI